MDTPASETTRTVATVYSQSDILEQEVYLVERLDRAEPGDQLFHLKARAGRGGPTASPSTWPRRR